MKHLLAFLLLLCSASVSAQDVIVKKDGSTIVCRVVELTATEITYKKWSDLNGSNYVMDRSLASAINYENGKKVNLSEVDNQYRPGNQNDGTQQYNDRALLEIDAASHRNLSRMKTKNTFRWIGGSILTAGTVLWTIEIIALSFDSNTKWDASAIAVFGIEGLGVWGSYALLKSASKHQKEIKQLSELSLFQYDFKLSNGSSLSTGIDIIGDHNIGSNTLGFGLRYNF